MILVYQQIFIANLITELLTYIISGLQRMAWKVETMQLNEKVLSSNLFGLSAKLRDPTLSKSSW